FGLDRGFHYLDARIEDDVRYTPRDALRQFAWHAQLLHCRRADEIEAIASAVAGKAIRGDHPFFLFVNFMDAHSPYAPPGSRGVRIEPLTDRFMDEMLHGHLDVSPAARALLISQYDAAITFVDDRVGELIQTLWRNGAYDNTLIIITSDHGEAFGDKGFIGHGNSVYQDAVHIPLLIKFPRQTAGALRTEPVALTDLYGTVLGEQFGTSLQHPAPQSRIAISEGFTARRGPLRAIRAAVGSEYKLIVEAGTPHVFDIRNDPNEEHDLAGTVPAEVVAPLQAAITAVARLTPHNRTGKPLDPETVRRLRALGYLR
ncbi:MAG TPA: sulfatase-like hydrolase/transferase, partial [Thermoanaerobaculia bacterium]